MDEPPSKSLLVGIVGPCGSGKSTLVEGLEKHGYECRHIAQEHSYVPDMWQLITQPDILIYLNASFACDVLKIVCDREFDMIDTRFIQFIQDGTL